MDTVDRCRHCGVAIPRGAAIYADHNRKYCSESCARAQLDIDQGSAHRATARGGPRGDLEANEPALRAAWRRAANRLGIGARR
jgi:hypothetical protein